ncbi:uncharacterized protein associated with RNAses G and E [Spiroplasma clarkii]|uniref:DUF402 domain-containing protein n=1 Tax=Spiroplasma clarkii TaxID=2139 RepID=A0A1Y0L360_9MOLU|nr:DUF402 domain-containing protein [Spiroplasma clarkii]ARU92148.1 uncharacterized protein associated with RNAses G and E [Spiroplasma clarkii]ATX71480.1 hypothetical protein SCLAR_v1c11800 [Spiroplasma clarkii]
MSDIKPGDKVIVHAYKHKDKLYRSWSNVTFLEETDEYILLVNEDVLITELGGRKWRTNEPALWFFVKQAWYNIICMFKEQEINYYCNLASPFEIVNNEITYVDYDLDIKVFNDNSFKILDLKEFNRNRFLYKYSREMVETIWENVDVLKQMIKARHNFFNHNYAKEKWQDYILKVKSKKKY